MAKKENNSEIGVYRSALIIVFLILMVSISDSCQKDKQNQNLLNNIAQLNFDKQEFETTITKNKERLSSQSQIILTQKEAIKNGLIEIDRLKKIKSKVRVVTKTKIDTVYVPYTKKIIDTVSNKLDYRNYFDYVEPKDWFRINGYASKNGLTIDSLSVKNELSIYIADKKLGLFKKSKPSVMVLSKNPYTETVEMSNVVIKNYKPFYKKNLFWGGLGLLGGFLLAR